MIWYVLGFLLTAAGLLLGGMRQAVKCFHGRQLRRQLPPFPKACCLHWNCWNAGTSRSDKLQDEKRC